ncbi:MAG: sulfatase-like hydrolase/transferase, partial [Verrucomicrobiota bacterium]
GRIWEKAEQLGDGFRWMQRSKITGGFIDEALPFMARAADRGQPFYINLWPDDVHGPFWPPVDQWGNGKRELYLSVLEEMDRQLGVLFEFIRKDEVLRENTLVLICSDNGPEKGAGVAGPFRGFKTHLYEGGIRSSLVVWGPGLTARKGAVNQESVFSAIDLVPTLLELTGTSPPAGVIYDGEPLLSTLLGQGTASRSRPLFFRRPPDRDAFYGDDDLPDLAIRQGRWKFLCEYDGEDPELYDMEKDRGESTNLAALHPVVVSKLTRSLVTWHRSMPPDRGADFVRRNKKKSG